jgi:tRNA threonylcarbamoyladenosine biosynthesis protein TsaB
MGHVRTLALDTSSQTGSIAVMQEGECLGIVSTRNDEAFSSRLFRQLQFLLDEFSLKLQDFDLFAVCTGPGSFTGLRVGLTAVKGWAEVNEKPIAAVSGLEAVAVQSRCGAGTVIPVLDARRGQVYFGKYERTGGRDGKDPEGKTRQEESVMTPDEFFRELAGWETEPANVTIATPDPALIASPMEQFQAPARMPKIFVEQVSAVLAPHIGRLGYLQAKQGRLTDSLSLDANYVRRADAELKWKDPIGL